MSRSSSRGSKLARNIIAVIIAVNLAAGVIYALVKKVARPPAEAADTSQDVSRALRAAGLAALEAGRYDEAVKRFTDAAKSSKASADLQQLIQIAVDLRDKSQPTAVATTAGLTTQKPAEPAPAEPVKPEPVAVKPEPAEPSPAEPVKPTPAPPSTAKTREQRLREAREQKEREAREAREAKERERQRRLAAAQAAKPREEPEPTPAPAPVAVPGTIIVSSTPSGLNVQLDGKLVDRTPVRLSAEPGPHEVQLLQGSTVVFTRRVTIAASAVMTIDPDVTAQIALLNQPAKTVKNEPAVPAPAAPAPTPVAAPTVATPPAAEEPKVENKVVETPAPTQHQLIPDHLYVVANPGLGLKSISSSQLADIYYGRTTTLNGRAVTPILRSPNDGAGSKFFKQVLRTSVRPYRDEWQRLSAAGKGTPPSIIAAAPDLWSTVNSRSGAISFVLGSEFDGASTSLRPVKITD